MKSVGFERARVITVWKTRRMFESAGGSCAVEAHGRFNVTSNDDLLQGNAET